jgi:Arc/MetJ-type ribon-helix-helix transcriptional regulator
MKNKKITIRITESQLRMIRDQVILEEKTKSELIREMIDKQVKIIYRKRLRDGNK